MQKYFNSVTNSRGDAILGARVAVTKENGLPATIYSDNGVTVQANPMTTDGNGFFAFYAAAGRYTIRVSGVGIPPIVISDILLEDELADFPSREELSSPTGASEVGADTDGGTVQEVADNAKPIADYTALRAYTGRSVGVRVTSARTAGLFQRDVSDSTSADNGGVVIVDGSNRRWKRVFSGPLYPKWFGAVGNSSTDDTVALQKMMDTAVLLRTDVVLPRNPTGSSGLFLISAPIQINGAISIRGDGIGYSGLVCVGCEGFVIAEGVKNVTMEGFTIAQAVRYSVTPNSLTAIRVNGSTGSRPYYHSYRDLFIDGFEYVAQAAYLWNTIFENVQSAYCHNGIKATGASVNNFVQNCSLGGNQVANTVGITLGDGNTALEGWIIANSVIYGFANSVLGLYANNCIVQSCILDFIGSVGVLLQSSANGPSTCWNISENYMAFSAAGAAGVRLLNGHAASVAQHRGSVVSNNQILAYGGASLSYGILQDGAAERNNIITGNRIKATVYDLRLATGVRTIVTGNQWLGPGASLLVEATYANNEGTVITSRALLKQSHGVNGEFFGSVAPTSGDHLQGDICWYSGPATGTHAGWLCTVGGTPGTWVELGIVGGKRAVALGDSVAADLAALRADFNILLARLRSAGLMAP